MTSQVDICNSALIRLGSNPIVSLVDNNDRARTVSAMYDLARRALLRSHPWNFAQIQIQLPQLVNAPTFEYQYAYQIPFDCLRVLSLYQSFSRYNVVGRILYTDDSTINLYYISDIQDPNQFDSMFIECLALKIAKDIGYKITANASLIQSLKSDYESTFRQAKQYDSQEDAPRQFDDGTWLDSRFIFNPESPTL